MTGTSQGNQGNENHLKHGGAGAIKAIQRGTPFTGVVHQAEQEVKAELEQPGGLEAIVVNDATRLETASRLYFDAFKKAIQDQDFDQATAYIKVFGWLQGSTIRAWELVRQQRGKANSLIDSIDAAALVNRYRDPQPDKDGTDAQNS